MEYFLVKTQYDYADEFDVCDVTVLSSIELDTWKSDIITIIEDGGEYIHWFGSNEELEFTTKEMFLRGIETTPLEIEFALSLKILLGDDGHGTGDIFEVQDPED